MRASFQWKSFRGKLLLLVLLSLLPALALAVHRNLSQRQTEKSRLMESITGLARLVAAHETSFIKNARQLLGTLSELDFLVKTTNTQFSAVNFENLLKLSPDYLTFGLIESNGVLFASGTKTTGPIFLGDRSYFRETLRTKAFSVGEFQTGKITKSPGVSFGYPIFDGHSNVLRVLFSSLKVGVIGEAVKHVPLPARSSVLIIDTAGHVMARFPEIAGLPGTLLTNSVVVQKTLAIGQGVFEAKGMDSEHRIYSVVPVANGTKPAFYVVVGMPTRLLFEEADSAFHKSLLFLGFIAAFVLSLTWVFANRSLIGPVRQLAARAHELAEANWSVRAEMSDTTELNELAESFNRMAERLERREAALTEANAKINQLNAELEKKVRERTAQLTEANKELEAFSYSVSHDLRAPLRHLDGFAQLLQKHQSKQLDDRGRRHLTVISDSAKKMGLLIDELLAFSRMGRKEMLSEKVDAAQQIEEVVREAARAPNNGNREIAWVISPLPEVKGDRAMLRQVWVNLIGNAIKYSSGAPLPRIEVGHFKEGGERVFFVRDNGAGFDMQYQDKLFGVFQRLHSDAEFEGVGIGLANVKRIVARHGGRVWAEGKPGAGATFYFSLPE